MMTCSKCGSVESKDYVCEKCYRVQWRDCCDCVHGKEIRSNLCRTCFDDTARPDWVDKWSDSPKWLRDFHAAAASKAGATPAPAVRPEPLLAAAIAVREYLESTAAICCSKFDVPYAVWVPFCKAIDAANTTGEAALPARKDA